MTRVCKYDNLHIKIDTENYEYLRDIKEHFSSYVEGYQHMPAFKNTGWDGRVSMMNLVKKTLPYGLLTDLVKYHKKYCPNEEIIIEPDVLSLFRGKEMDITYDLKFMPHYYQAECIEAALKYTKGIIRSATASGKSLIIAYILKTLFENRQIESAVIIVPTIALVEQFYGDLLDYGYFTKNRLGRVYEKSKEFDMDVVISTWQTLSNNHDKLSKFDCVICDETHSAKAYEIKKILQKCGKAKYRLGFTGTLPSSKVDMWNVKSFLGPIIREYGAGELGEQGYISKCNVTVLDIKYQNEYRGTYDSVKDEIFQNTFRMSVMQKIVEFVDSNILLLVGKVEKEGQVLKEFLEKKNPNKKVVFLSGTSKVEEREFWRKECGKRNDVVLIATYGIFQMGVNIPSLKYIILASPYKSKIRILQSIGRVLRKHESKTDGAYVYDIFDDCKYLYEHGIKRERHYRSEGFNVIDIVLEEGSDLSTLNLSFPSIENKNV